tara:strand:- start:241 stop:861 length:621 start_codon:yes stop_codon:yes gene_type:complete
MDLNLAIDELKHRIVNDDLPYRYFITYDFHLGDRYEHEEFSRVYLWNGIANRLKTKVRVWAVGLNPIGKRDHIHAVISTSKPLENKCNLYGIVDIPFLMLIDGLFEQQFGIGRFYGDKFKGSLHTDKRVILGDNARFFRAVPFGGYDRWRLQIQPYDVDMGGVGYIAHHHDVILWVGNDVINEFKPYKSKRKRYRRGKRKGEKQLT